jgi:acetate---CoA ligase (ADP-forming)
MTDFTRLFSPRSIAIVGASTDENTTSGQPVRFLREHGYPGAVYPINPKVEQIGALRCYPDVASLPEAPDLALVAVAARRVPETLRQLAAKGVRLAIVISSGFAEAGGEGHAAQQEIADIARSTGLRVIGPNCQGMMNIDAGYALGFGPPFGLKYRRGSVSLTSQSGAFGNSVLMLADEEGVGFRHYLSTGNEADTTTLDLVEHFADDPGTRIVASYVEGFRDAHRAVAVGRRLLAAGKPWLVWKVGNSAAGAKAAASHTANLGGAPALYRAAFRQAGAIEVHDVGDLADCVRALESTPLPRGPRMAVVTVSGGAGILMADRCSDAGLQLPALADATLAELRTLLPAFAGLNNPVDLTAEVLRNPGVFGQVLRLIARDPNIDMLGLPLAAISGPAAMTVARELVALRAEIDLPIMVAWNGPEATTREAYALVDQAGIARYRTPVRCARGFDALWQHAQARAALSRAAVEAPMSLHRPAAQAALRGRRQDLAEHEAKALLADYGITPTRETLAATREAAVAAAQAIGFPVVMKIQSADIPHKTEAGGVRIGLADAAAVAAAYDEIVANARRHVPGAVLDGVLVQEMVRGAVEVIVGVQNDPSFGPALMFGLGGIHAEVMKDVTFRLAPVSGAEARAMLREIRAWPLLDGARGAAKADAEALADALERVSALAIDLREQLAELDINPLFVLPQGQGVRAGDALIKPRQDTAA